MGQDLAIVEDAGWIEFCRSPGAGYLTKTSVKAFRHVDVVHVNGLGRRVVALVSCFRNAFTVTASENRGLAGSQWSRDFGYSRLALA